MGGIEYRTSRPDQLTTERSDHLCECGCGELTMVAPKTRSERGWLKGQPKRFVYGHGGGAPPRDGSLRLRTRGRRHGPVRPCACGCGEIVATVKARYVKGHGRRSTRTYVVDEASGCWVWCGAPNSHGYGRLRVGDRGQVKAHRFVFEREVGPIPEGHELHHTCENKMCVNPAHLIPLTPEEHKALHSVAA